MIDINTIINNAISNAVNQAIQPIREHYDAHIESLRAEIEQLKAQRAVSPATGEVNAEFIRSIAMDAAETVMAEHLEGYDHDEYDSTVTTVEDFPDFDDLVTKEDLRNATVSFNL